MNRGHPVEIALVVALFLETGRSYLRGVKRYLLTSGPKNARLRLVQAPETPAAQVVSTLRALKPDGIICSEMEQRPVAACLERSTVPLVVIGSRKSCIPRRVRAVSFVSVDERALAAFAADRLLGLGNFPAYCYTHHPNPDYAFFSKTREEEFLRLMASHGKRTFVFPTADYPPTLRTERLLRWLDALPKPAVTMAANATNDQRNDYIIAAKAVENGQVSVWPSGSTIADFAGGSRGVDPFQNFIRHQEELIVLLATGGTLTSLATADTGALAGGAQMEVWKQIVNRDAGVLSQAVQLAIVRPFLERNFWGRPVAADFGLTMPFKMTPQEAANVAATLKQAGWRVDQDELEKAVGFTLEKDETNPAFGGGMPPGGGAFGAARATDGTEPRLKRLKPHGADEDGQGEGSGADALAEAFSRVLAESMADELTKGEDHE